jgi:hypothetical protein
VDRIDDIRGASYGSFVFAAGTRPILRAVTGGGWELDFPPGSGGVLSWQGGSIDTANCSVYVAKRVSGRGNWGMMFGAGPGSAGSCVYTFAQGTDGNEFPFIVSGAIGTNNFINLHNRVPLSIPTAAYSPTPNRAAWISNTANLLIRDELDLRDNRGPYHAGVQSGLHLGAWRTGNFPFAGRIRRLLVYRVCHDTTTARRIWDYLGAQYGTPVEMPTDLSLPIVVCLGDSRTYGVNGPNDSLCYPTRLAASLGAAVNVRNYGVPGSGPVQLPPAASAAITQYSRISGRKVAVVWTGVNGAYSTSMLSTYTWPACDTLRAAGWKVVVCSELAYSADTSPSNDSNRQAWLTPFYANWATHADYMADLAADATIGTFAATANGTYCDGLHWTDAANAIIEGIVRTQVQSALS